MGQYELDGRVLWKTLPWVIGVKELEFEKFVTLIARLVWNWEQLRLTHTFQ
jgi:hypothetical protein